MSSRPSPNPHTETRRHPQLPENVLEENTLIDQAINRCALTIVSTFNCFSKVLRKVSLTSQPDQGGRVSQVFQHLYRVRLTWVRTKNRN